MKKIMRYLLSIVVVAIVFLVASVAIFIAVFDANAYKQDLSDLVREQTGRELEFHGDVSLTIYPALGMKRFISSPDVVLIKPNVGFDRPPHLGVGGDGGDVQGHRGRADVGLPRPPVDQYGALGVEGLKMVTRSGAHGSLDETEAQPETNPCSSDLLTRLACALAILMAFPSQSAPPLDWQSDRTRLAILAQAPAWVGFSPLMWRFASPAANGMRPPTGAVVPPSDPKVSGSANGGSHRPI